MSIVTDAAFNAGWYVEVQYGVRFVSKTMRGGGGSMAVVRAMLYRLYVVVTYVSSVFSWANSVTIVVLLN